MVIPKAHTSLSFDCLTVPCPSNSSGDQNATVPFVVVVTSPSDRLISATICEHPKSLMIALRVGVIRILSLAMVRIQVKKGEKASTHCFHIRMYHTFIVQVFKTCCNIPYLSQLAGMLDSRIKGSTNQKGHV